MKVFLFAPAVLLVLVGFGLGGCSRDDGDGVATAPGATAQVTANPSAPAADPAERVRQFVACMRAEGIDVPDPAPGDATGKSALQFDESSGDKAKVGAAMEKCVQYLPQGGEPEQMSPEELARAQQFAQCMRENGVPDFPDPDPNGRFGPGSSVRINKDDPAFQAAIEKCNQGAKK
jgi:hypothetical protein